MGHRFVEGKIEGEKEFGRNVFPKTLKPPSEMNTDGVDELVEMVKEEREWLNKTLEAHSAILFKGFGVKSAEEFDRAVEAFGWENMTYSAPAPKPILRHLVAGRVYTSNATPVTQLITFHHEMAWVREVPSKIFFYCAQPSPEGGETSILCSQVVVDQMEEKEPDFVSKVSTTGIVHRISLQMEYDSKDAEVVNAPWNWILDNKDLAEAQKSNGSDELMEMVKEEIEWLNKTLDAHSAILFKGFGLKSAEEFDRVAKAFGWEYMTYSAPAPKPIVRHLVAGRVYTSNDTPVTQFITFHHEMAWVREVRSKIFFYCLQLSPEGGETSILPGQVVVHQIEEKQPEFVSSVSDAVQGRMSNDSGTADRGFLPETGNSVLEGSASKTSETSEAFPVRTGTPPKQDAGVLGSTTTIIPEVESVLQPKTGAKCKPKKNTPLPPPKRNPKPPSYLKDYVAK